MPLRLTSSLAGAALLKDREARARHDGPDAFLDWVLQCQPDCCAALNRRALHLFEQGRYADAQRDLERCVRLQPYFADAVHNLALCCHETGQLDRALALYTRAIVLEGDAVSLNNRGLLYNDLKLNHKAIDDFLIIIERLNPRYVDAWNNIAFAYNCVVSARAVARRWLSAHTGRAHQGPGLCNACAGAQAATG